MDCARVILIASVFALLGFQTSASPAQLEYVCTNQAILRQPITLVLTPQGPLVADQSLGALCEYRQTASDFADSQYQGWVEWEALPSSGDPCLFSTKMREPQNRLFLRVRTSPQVLLGEEGFVQVAIDNSMADYGPIQVKTFFKCFSVIEGPQNPARPSAGG
jgi:hypothetical protein